MSPDSESQARRRSILRSTTVTTLLTTMSRVLGLVREQVRGHYLGTGMASDAFGVASLLPNLLRRLFAEGAMTAAFVPVYAELRSRSTPAELSEFVGRFFTFLTLAVTVVCLLGMGLSSVLVPLLFPGFDAVPGKTELTVALSIITWPYLIFVSTAAVVQGILNSHRIFGPSAFTPVLLNLITIGLVVIFEDWFPSPEVAFAWGFTLGGVAQLVFQLPYLRGLGLKIRPDLTFGPSVRQVLRVMLPGTFAAGIYQINVLVSQYVATLLAEGAVSGLQYSLRLQELVLGVFAVSLTTVLLPSMSEQVVKNNHEGLKDTLRFACALIAFVCVPASVGLIVVARPLVRLLFESGAFDRASTELTAHALVFHAAGIYAIAMSRIVTQVFYAFQDLRTPTLVAAGVMLVHAALAVGLSLPLAHGGIALAGGLASALNTVWLWGLLRQRIGTLGTRALAGSLGRIALATAAMAGAVAGLQALTNPMAAASRAALGGWILLEVTVGVAAFFIMARWLRCPELMELLAMLRRRRARRARMAGNSGAGGE